MPLRQRSKLQFQATMHKDIELKALLVEIAKVPKFIASWVLTLFVWKCRDFYQIAFFQWRRAYPNKLKYDLEQIVELIDFRMNFTFRRDPNKGRPCCATKEAARLPGGSSQAFLEKYNLVCIRKRKLIGHLL